MSVVTSVSPSVRPYIGPLVRKHELKSGKTSVSGAFCGGTTLGRTRTRVTTETSFSILTRVVVIKPSSGGYLQTGLFLFFSFCEKKVVSSFFHNCEFALSFFDSKEKILEIHLKDIVNHYEKPYRNEFYLSFPVLFV